MSSVDTVCAVEVFFIQQVDFVINIGGQVFVEAVGHAQV
jgi:hypothetical protein